MIDMTAGEERADDARARANVMRLAAAQALTGANSAVIFATGSIVGAAIAPDMALATVPLSMYVLGMAAGTLRQRRSTSRACQGALPPFRNPSGQVAFYLCVPLRMISST